MFVNNVDDLPNVTRFQNTLIVPIQRCSDSGKCMQVHSLQQVYNDWSRVV